MGSGVSQRDAVGFVLDVGDEIGGEFKGCFGRFHCYNIPRFLEKVKGWREVFSESCSQVVSEKSLPPPDPPAKMPGILVGGSGGGRKVKQLIINFKQRKPARRRGAII